jgi:hypothetical protein
LLLRVDQPRESSQGRAKSEARDHSVCARKVQAMVISVSEVRGRRSSLIERVGLVDHPGVVVPVTRVLVHKVVAHLNAVTCAGSGQHWLVCRRPFRVKSRERAPSPMCGRSLSGHNCPDRAYTFARAPTPVELNQVDRLGLRALQARKQSRSAPRRQRRLGDWATGLILVHQG